jgi:hypothetical protein
MIPVPSSQSGTSPQGENAIGDTFSMDASENAATIISGCAAIDPPGNRY